MRAQRARRATTLRAGNSRGGTTHSLCRCVSLTAASCLNIGQKHRRFGALASFRGKQTQQKRVAHLLPQIADCRPRCHCREQFTGPSTGNLCFENGVRNTAHNANADRQKQRIMAVSHKNNPEVGREADRLNEDESGETIR